MYVLYYCIILKGQNILFLSSIIASQVMDDENDGIIL